MGSQLQSFYVQSFYEADSFYERLARGLLYQLDNGRGLQWLSFKEKRQPT